MIKCIVVDDEEMSRLALEQLLSRLKTWKIVAACTTVAEAHNLLAIHEIDVIFLDIELPDMNALDFLSTMKEPPEIVLISSQEKYALTAFEHDVADYLLKPVTPSRFLKTITRLEERLSSAPETSVDLEGMFVRNNNQMSRILFRNILWIEAFGDYVNILTEQERFVVHATMKGIQAKLPSDQFMRVHRSFIVRTDKIDAIEDTLIVINKKLIPIGESYRADMMARLNFL